MIGVAVPKYVYNSCPLKHEVVNLLMSSEMLYHEDLRYSNWKVTCIKYNTIHHHNMIFHDLVEGGIPMLSFINFYFMYIDQIVICRYRLEIL